MTDELKTLFPGKEIALSTGETLTIKPFKFGQLPKALSLAQAIAKPLIEAYKSSADGVPAESNNMLILKVISEGGEDFIKLMSIAVGKDRAWFDNLESDDGAKIAAAFLEVNLDFFTQRVLPVIQEAMPQMTGLGQA